MSTGFCVGDVVLLPPTQASGYRTFDGYVATVTEVNNTQVIVCTNDGHTLTCDVASLTLIGSYKDTLRAFTQKGVELVERAEQR